MQPLVFLAAIILVLGVPALTMVKLARLRAARHEAPSNEVLARLESLEREVQDLQRAQGETLERLDFTERLLTKARDEPQLGS